LDFDDWYDDYDGPDELYLEYEQEHRFDLACDAIQEWAGTQPWPILSIAAGRVAETYDVEGEPDFDPDGGYYAGGLTVRALRREHEASLDSRGGGDPDLGCRATDAGDPTRTVSTLAALASSPTRS
jgi:hypothetical protein